MAGLATLLKDLKDECVFRVRQMCLISKLRSIAKYREGKEKALSNFRLHWECIVNSKYNTVNKRVRQRLRFRDYLISVEFCDSWQS